jgi:hypothetical protein
MSADWWIRVEVRDKGGDVSATFQMPVDGPRAWDAFDAAKAAALRPDIVILRREPDGRFMPDEEDAGFAPDLQVRAASYAESPSRPWWKLWG